MVAHSRGHKEALLWPPLSVFLLPRPRRTISARKLEANRRNAKRSTGPRTAEGKARVARNAVKHGFFARIVRIQSDGRPKANAPHRSVYLALDFLYSAESALGAIAVTTEYARTNPLRAGGLVLQACWKIAKTKPLEAMRRRCRPVDEVAETNPFDGDGTESPKLRNEAK